MFDESRYPEVTDGRASRWAGQRAKRRGEFVTAAIEAITLHGPAVSTEQIATHAGIARPRLYRHFDDADDLYQAVGHRAAEMIVADIAPVLSEPAGSSRDMIDRTVRTFVTWLTEHTDLYRYVAHRATASAAAQDSVIADIKQAIAAQVSRLVSAYFVVFEVDSRVADPLSFGLVGMVESTVTRWLREPGDLNFDDLVDSLSSWIWGTFDQILRREGVVLDPDETLPPLPS